MSQHAYTIANQAGAAFRSDVVAAFQAGASNNLATTAPATLYAGMWWADTTSGWMKQRNAANSGWNKKFPLDSGARVDVASAATIGLDAAAVTSDYVRLTGTTAISAVTLAEGQRRFAVAGGAVPITHGASLIVLGGASYTCAAGDLLLFIGEAAGVVRVLIWKADGTAIAVAVVAPVAREVLQVVYATDAGSNTSAATLTNITGSAKSITPKSNNSTLIVECLFDATVAAGGVGVNTTGIFQLYNNTAGANIGQQFSLGVVSGGGENVQTQGPGAIAALVTNSALTAIGFILRAKYGTGACQVTGANHVWKITEVQN